MLCDLKFIHIYLGGIVLLIHRMTATFGKLQGKTLELKDGLNILHAPNESGKSTWCAFLTAMFYGINSRERDRAGFIAEKNRYAPWSGVSMSGRLDLRCGENELTLTRTTRRAGSPMGEFQAAFSGTGDAVPGLTGQNCGETLLGVSREVFERSAFIRQNGLAVTQDAGLERRIAALISSGEEDTSYSEAMDALKKQLNRRRHNKTGQLPALEQELAETEHQLAALEELEQALAHQQAQVEALETRNDALAKELAAHDAWEAQEQQRAYQQAQASVEEARQRAQLLRSRLEADGVPENDAIGRLRGAIVNLETVRKSVDKARAERDEAMKAMLRAEAAVNESPFAGQTAESARKEAQAASPDRIPGPIAFRELAIFFLFLAAAGGVFALLYSQVSVLSLPLVHLVPWVLPALAAAAVAAAGAYISRLYRRHALEKLRNAALMKRFGTTDTDAIQALADTYVQLLERRDAAQAEVHAKTSTADALYASLTSNEQGILLEVRRFAPSAFDVPAADAQLRGAAVRRKELADAEAAVREAQMRCDWLAQQLPQTPADSASPTPPQRSREAVAQELNETQAALTAARSAADNLNGRLHAAGDPVVLRSQAESLQSEIHRLEGEYDAIQTAMEALTAANTTLQNRFSPALGRRAAEIFSQLTGGRYSGVVLDRAFHLSAEPAEDPVYRDAALLSVGTVDQLYLAVRLAICELVLPQETGVPLILDDALANFDADRCEAALTWLKEAARDRQILLFTCHDREAAFFRGDGEVSIQELTEAAAQV